MTERRCEQHWSHGRGIQSGLNLLRGAVVKQSCNTHGFPCAQRSLSVVGARGGTVAAGRKEQLACGGSAVKRCQTIFVESVCRVLSAASACKQKVYNGVVAASSSSSVQRRPDNSASQKQTLETAEPRSLKLLELLTSTHRFSPSHFRDYLLLPSERELSDAVHGRAVTAHLLHKQREATFIRDNITSGSSDELRLERSFCSKNKKKSQQRKHRATRALEF